MMIWFGNLELTQFMCLGKFKFVFETIQVENLRVTFRTMSFSNSLFMLS